MHANADAALIHEGSFKDAGQHGSCMESQESLFCQMVNGSGGIFFSNARVNPQIDI